MNTSAQQRGEVNGHPVYTLWDLYPQAHIVTYPSLYEGFGNALIESLYFRVPLVVNTYPIYLSDIKPAGVRAVEFLYDISETVLDETRRLIDDATWRDQITTHNYAGRVGAFLIPSPAAYAIARTGTIRHLDTGDS